MANPHPNPIIQNETAIETVNTGEILEFNSFFYVPFAVSKIEIRSIVKDSADLPNPYLLQIQNTTNGHNIGGLMGQWSPLRTIYFNPPRQFQGDLDVSVMEIVNDNPRKLRPMHAVNKTSMCLNITFYN